MNQLQRENLCPCATKKKKKEEEKAKEKKKRKKKNFKGLKCCCWEKLVCVNFFSGKKEKAEFLWKVKKD